MRYQTEIYVPIDRYVCLQLPDYLPEGRAQITVTVTVEPEEPVLDDQPADADGDRQDIEWWDDLGDEEVGRRP